VALASGQARTYRVSRVVSVAPTEDRSIRPEGFDLAAFWAESSAAYERDAPRVDVTLRVREDRLWRLRDVVGSHVVDAAQRIEEPDPEGWIRLRVRLDWPDEVPAQLLSVGSNVEVLDPPEIRDGLIRIARRIVERYEPAPTRS
jgi:predicted DNA-binding transcriptional regulator YafY